MKYYKPSLRQIEDWHYNHTLSENQRPPIMKIELELHQMNIPAIFTAFEKLIKKHESLRTTFPIIKGEMWQQVEPYNHRHHLKFLEINDENTLQELADKLILRMKDIIKGPLFTGVLLRSKGSVYLFMFIHHIISDQWSLNLIKRNLFQAYHSELTSSTNTTSPECKVLQLGEYIRCRKYLLEDQSSAFWDKYLRDRTWETNYDNIYQTLAQNHFSTWKQLRPADLIAQPTGETYISMLDESAFSAIKSFQAKTKLSVNVLLLAAQTLTGSKLSQTDHVLIQSHFSCRHEKDAEEIIGNLIGKLLILNRVDKNQSIENYIFQINSSFYHAVNHILFTSEGLNTYELSTKSFLFFNFLPTQVGAGKAVEIQKARYVTNTWVESPLVCQAFEHPNSITFKWSYHLDFFNRAQIKLISDCFTEILNKLAISQMESIGHLLRSVT